MLARVASRPGAVVLLLRHASAAIKCPCAGPVSSCAASVGMALAKSRGWAAGITSRAVSTQADLNDYMKLDSPLTENQLYLIQMIDEVRMESRQQVLEVMKEAQQLADELDAINALQRDAISECRAEMVTATLRVLALGGLIFLGMDSTAGGSAPSAPGTAASISTSSGSA